MKELTQDYIKDWVLNYSTYVDTLRLFNDDIYSKKSKDLRREDFSKYTIVYYINSSKPVLFEMKHASNTLGEIDNLTKEDIIHRVIGYIHNNG